MPLDLFITIAGSRNNRNLLPQLSKISNSPGIKHVSQQNFIMILYIMILYMESSG